MKIKFHYAWIIVFVIFLSLLGVQGVRLSFGAFVEPWEKDFSMGRGTVSLISTQSFIIYGLSQPIIGRLVDKFGARLILSVSTFLVAISIMLTAVVYHPWQLFILYGVFLSLGVGGASNVVATVVVTNWFNEKRGLALGLVEAGFGVGQMLLVPGSLLLIQWIDWKWTVVILGLFLMIIVLPVILLFLKDHPSEKGMELVGGYSKEEKNIGRYSSNLDMTMWGIFRKRQF